jgi:hypothetical protein
MKLRAEILSVSTTGDTLTVGAQAKEVAASEWHELAYLTFRVRDIAANRKALHVGRILTVTIEAK